MSQVPLRSTYLLEDTICAISTSLGGAIAVVRVSGPRSFETLKTITSESVNGNPAVFQSEPRKLVRTRLFSGAGPIDDALIVRFVSPQSYSGEDMVEYHIHGGHYIAHRVIEVLVGLGLRQALPGEFSFRSVRNGKFSIFQAQAVADLIQASNDSALSLALDKISGEPSRFFETLASDIRRLAVLSEVGIDFSDQDVEEVSLPTLKTHLREILKLLENLKNSAARGISIQEGLKVAFIGPPNAGKSSFFNALLGEDRSIVSETAGTTRDVVREKITLRGSRATVTLRLEDTAGLRITNDPIEKSGIQRTYQAAKNADLLLFIVDSTSDFNHARKEWEELLHSMDPAARSFAAQSTLGILTKTDLLQKESIEALESKLQTIGPHHWAKTSAKDHTGIQEAVETIVTLCETKANRQPGELLLTRIEHKSAVSHAIEHLVRAREASEIDLFASDIRQGLNALSPLIGETLPDDILGQIFSNFCIGK